MHRKI